MSERLFTPEEVNRLIPRLTELLDTGMERYRQAVALQERLREDRARVAAAGADGQTSPAPMRLFHLSIAYLTLLFAAVAVTALLPWGRW